MGTSVRLIAGLGNPGARYAETRHNVGAWFVEALARAHACTFRAESKFHGHVAELRLDDQRCWLLCPNTYMNESGQAVGAMAKYYHVEPEELLIIHDELDFQAGQARFKQGGGHGGHNGLRNIMQHMGSNTFNRLRFGIGHPGESHLAHDYVLNKPSRADRQKINQAINNAIIFVPELLNGNWQHAIQQLHSS